MRYAGGGSVFSYTTAWNRLTAAQEIEAQARSMSFRSATVDASVHAAANDGEGEGGVLNGRDTLSWARVVWEEREDWLRARGGVESVFMAAQLLGCRDEAVLWLRQKTRL